MRKEQIKFKGIIEALKLLDATIKNEELAMPLPGDEPQKQTAAIKELIEICNAHLEALEIYEEE